MRGSEPTKNHTAKWRRRGSRRSNVIEPSTIKALTLVAMTTMWAACGRDKPINANHATCKAGESQTGTTACGLNNEGFLKQDCVDGVWVDNATCIDACTVDNGGCAQRCAIDLGDKSADCSCFPGFDLGGDGASCVPKSNIVLYNNGLGLFLDGSAGSLQFTSTGSPILMAPTPDAANSFTFTVQVTPGTCADGSSSAACVDQ